MPSPTDTPVANPRVNAVTVPASSAGARANEATGQEALEEVPTVESDARRASPAARGATRCDSERAKNM